MVRINVRTKKVQASLAKDVPTKKVSLPQAKWVLTHDDGKCANGQVNTVLENGYCPVCKYVPDMQSTCFIFHCPTHNVELGKDKKCPTCRTEFDTSKANFYR